MATDQIDFFFNNLNAQDQQAISSQRHTQVSPYKAIGCDACDQGYKGRIGIYQVMPISDAMQTLIMHDADAQALAIQAASEEVRTLRQAGWLKVLQGITSIEEIMTMTHHG
jgi:type IV pilus assembly protein PilB